jgi:hypothetical protein
MEILADFQKKGVLWRFFDFIKVFEGVKIVPG